jgi:hypothetical protein
MIEISLFWPFPPAVFAVMFVALALLILYWLWKFVWSIVTGG